MIYSREINRICAVCQMAHKHSDEEMYCEQKKQAVPINGAACEKFRYDILKKNVRRMKRLKTNYNPEDFSL